MEVVAEIFEVFIKILGIVTIVFFIVLSVYLATDKIRECCRRCRYRYIQKHRFDNPPTAKCYCVDCCYRKGDRCALHDFYVAEHWFCWEAEPIEKE